MCISTPVYRIKNKRGKSGEGKRQLLDEVEGVEEAGSHLLDEAGPHGAAGAEAVEHGHGPLALGIADAGLLDGGLEVADKVVDDGHGEAGAGEVDVCVVPGAMASTIATAADLAVSRIPFVFPAGGSGAARTGVFGVAGRAGAVSTLFKLPIESSSVGCSSVVVHRPSTMYL